MSDKFSGHELLALDSIVKPIFNGRFDFSFREKIIYAGLFGLATYAAYESSKLYFVIGGAGTNILPFPTFKSEEDGQYFGGQCAFWSNFTLNLYAEISTILAARLAVLHYLFAKELGIEYPLWKAILKLTIALGMAITSGVIFALIAGSAGTGVYNQVVTAIVNTLLNYLGSIALIDTLTFGYNKIYDSIANCRSSRKKNGEDVADISSDDTSSDNTSSDESSEELNTAEWITEHLDKKSEQLRGYKTDGQFESLNSSYANFKSFISAPNPNESDNLLIDSSPKKGYSIAFVATVMGWGATHFFTQFIDKMALLGYYYDTVKSVGELFKIQNNALKIFSGAMIFLSFACYSVYLIYKTTEAIIEGIKSTITSAWEFMKNPRCTIDTGLEFLSFILLRCLNFFGYFFSAISANTSLELNSQYGFYQWWNIYPAWVGTGMFNGYGFKEEIDWLANGVKYLWNLRNSPNKNEVLHKHNNVMSFFQSYPNAVDHFVKKTYVTSFAHGL